MRKGPIMAATAEFTITIEGRGGHAAMPHKAIDPVLIGSQYRHRAADHRVAHVRSAESVVVSVTKFHGGDAYNVIPQRPNSPARCAR
jgi:hippurate hydrolase